MSKNRFKINCESSQPQEQRCAPEENVLLKDQDLQKLDSKRKKTGIIAGGPAMREHKCPWDSNHPESPNRLTRVLQSCMYLDLPSKCEVIQAKSATDEEILRLHSIEHLNDLKFTAEQKGTSELQELASKYDSVYLHNKTCEASLEAAGSAIKLTESVAKGDIQNGMALLRPPGHHATYSQFNGFCFLNNVALAAANVLHKKLANRILIIDWDVHHGQGIQELFYDTNKVLYISIHRYDHGKFWPNLKESNYNYIGAGRGTGYNINVPLNKTGMRNEDYLAIFFQLILPVAYEFCPDLCLVASGYDSATGDTKGEMEVTPGCFAHMMGLLQPLAGGKIVAILEGGYCLSSLSAAASLTLRSLIGEPCLPIDLLTKPSDSVVESLSNICFALRPFWKSLNFQKESTEVTWPAIRFEYHEEVDNANNFSTAYGDYRQEDSASFDHKVVSQCDKLMEKVKQELKSLPVAIVFNESGKEKHFRNDGCYVETPNRLKKIYEVLQTSNILVRCAQVQNEEKHEEAEEIESIVKVVHDSDYVDHMKRTMFDAETARPLNTRDMHVDKTTHQTALHAVNALLKVTEGVIMKKYSRGFALVRPPGHHAQAGKAGGFCMYNNVAVAAKVALNKHKLERILILDWDIHHGNGTQKMFESESRVLYISMHLYNRAKFYPGSKVADVGFVGKELGEGFNINIPWNTNCIGDGDYLATFFRVILPVAYEFKPQLVFISAGFDAAIRDPLGRCAVTPEAFGHFAKLLSSLASGNLILSLEGGYHMESLSMSAAWCAKALLDDPLPPLEGDLSPSEHAVDVIRKVIQVHGKYWKCLVLLHDVPLLPFEDLGYYKT